ncbi:hypothetical protein KR018_004467, partial [Drosophila ironensis]
RMRKCVVKIKRLKIPNIVEVNKSPDGEDTIRFDPARNSTMVGSENAQMQRKNQAPRKIVPGSAKTGFPRPGSSLKSCFSSLGALFASPCRVRLKRISLAKPVTEASTSKARFFHRDQPPPRSRSSMRSVYEFLSESQIEDADIRKDPAEDIIQRMVNDGKACLMVRSKAHGKDRVKPIRKRKIRPVGRRRQVSIKKTEPVPMPSENAQPLGRPRKKPPARALSPILEPLDDSSNNAEDVYADAIEVPVQVHQPPSPARPNTSKHAGDGAYSSLARSVLLNQTKAQEGQTPIDKRRELLDMARQLVSTPLNRKTAPLLGNNATASGISPIPQKSPSGGASPWRVSDESAMPNTFVFGFNTSQLPSYSSDHIRTKHVYLPGEKTIEPLEELPDPVSINQSSVSTANDSNEENRPPSISQNPPTLRDHSIDENAKDSEDFVHMPNPRKTLQNRTPFKDINVLDVVVLPSWKKTIEITPSKEKTPNRASNALAAATKSPPNRSQTRTNLFGFDPSPEKHEQNLFGFEEFLGENVDPAIDRPASSQDVTLHAKLQRLAELRPTNKELPEVSTASLRHDYLGEVISKQQDIRTALCSTMIIPAAPPKQRHAALGPRESVGLFREEPEPQSSFSEKNPRRTYVRERPKRKRKQRVHALYVESESSEEEDEQDSQDNSQESPSKRRPNAKRSRKDIEHESKLNEFITTFNKQCEEVEKFPLIIE